MWQKTKHGLYKEFVFKDFKEAFNFVTRVADLAEKYNHHPRWENNWNVVQIWFSTHDAGDKITDKDTQMAELVDKIDNSSLYKPNLNGGIRFKLYADGGSRGNPGPSASGYVITDTSDKILVDEGVYLGVTTNNQAEYTALKLGLEKCLKMDAEEVDVFMDSLLVVNQMIGIFKVKNRDLWPIFDSIKTTAQKIKKVSYQHIPRELNKLADAAVNRALDEELRVGK